MSFLSTILSGNFHVFYEVTPPHVTQPLAEAKRSLSELGSALSQEGWCTGAVLADSPDGILRQDLLPLRKALTESLEGGYVIRMLSGKGRSVGNAQEVLSEELENGQSIFCAASGDGEPLGDQYLDSVTALKLCQSAFPQAVAGATVNFSKYAAPDIALSYAKLSRKLRSGARFLLSQCGWDMAKAQELQWELQLRDTLVPVLARVMWFSPDLLEDLPGALPPGVLLPELWLRDLRTAYAESPAAGRALQLRGLAAQMVGYRRLGFTGVLLSGAPAAEERQDLRAAFEEALDRLPDYATWCRDWKANYAPHMEPPVRAPKRLFAHLLDPECRDPEKAVLDPTSALDTGVALLQDRVVATLLRKIANVPEKSPLRKCVCKVLGVRSSELPLLAPLGYLPNDSCPKRLTEGACGNVRENGGCECNPNQLCFFRRVLALAAKQGSLAELES